MSDAIRFLPFVRRSGLAAPEIHFAVNGKPGSVPVSTFGPGDVVGIDAREILRRDPAPGAIDLSPNYLAAVELRRADLPWCVSPGAPDVSGRLMPWIALIVVDADRPPPSRRSGAPLPVIEIPSGDLPPWEQLWAWGHVQLVADAAESAETILKSDPARALARLIAPRALEPKRGYRACLVPTFEAGRLAGLGQLSSLDPRSAAPAWGAGPDPIALPVYAEWTFTTGEAGDFEALARRLEARDLADHVQPLPIDGAAVSAGTIPLPSALRPLAGRPPWTGDEPAAARRQIELWLARPSVEERPVLGPPLYGGTAQGTALPEAGFLADLNLDPRYRAAAGLGAEIVRRDQERLVARAWEALGDARRAGRERDGALLADLLGRRLVSRVESAPPSRQLLIASPAFSRIRRESASTTAAVRSSALPSAILAPAFRRAAATKGGQHAAGAHLDAAIATLALRRPTTGSMPATPAGMLTWNRLHAKLHPAARPPLPGRALGRRLAVAAPAGVRAPRALDPRTAAVSAFATLHFARRNTSLQVAMPGALAVVDVASAAVAALAPRALARLAPRLDLGDVAALSSDLAPLVASHDDPVPLAPRLVEIDRRFLLAGADVPPDTVGVLAVDAPFVEAVLIGANHELLRELAWRGVPSDRRATPLTQFFDVRGASAAPDIGDVRSFPRDSALGAHLRGRNHVVLLVKGELLRRFPDALVFAARAIVEDGVRKPGDEQRLPTFRGSIGEDTTYFGLDLDVASLLGGADDPGWFVVIQERPSAPRFGFDVAVVGATVPATWSDFTWSNVPRSGPYVSVAGPAPSPTNAGGKRWGENAAHMASISLQRPVRIAIHASLMIPARAT